MIIRKQDAPTELGKKFVACYYKQVAPTELKKIMVTVFYKQAAPTVLNTGEWIAFQ